MDQDCSAEFEIKMSNRSLSSTHRGSGSNSTSQLTPRTSTLTDREYQRSTLAIDSTHDIHHSNQSIVVEREDDESDEEDDVGIDAGNELRSSGHHMSNQSMNKHDRMGNNIDSIMAAFAEEDSTLQTRDIVQGYTRPSSCNVPHGGRVLAVLYGLVVGALALALPLKQALCTTWLINIIAAVFHVYLYAVSFVFLLGLEIYLVRAAGGRKKRRAGGSGFDALDPGVFGVYNPTYMEEDAKDKSLMRRLQRTWRQVSRTTSARSAYDSNWDAASCSEDYPDRSHQGASLYLRIVIIVLGLTSMVYDGLLIQQLSECGQIFWTHGVHLGFVLIQAYVLFKRTKMTVTSSRCVVVVGFVHVFVTNFAIIFSTFVRHTVEKYHSATLSSYVQTTPTPRNSGRLATACDLSLRNCMDGTETLASPFLYPCVLEYNLLAAALVYLLAVEYKRSTRDDTSDSNTKDVKVVIPRHNADINFRGAHKGLFSGLVVFAATVIVIVMVFAQKQYALLIYESADLGLHVVTLVGVLIAWGRVSAMPHVSLKQASFSFTDCVLMCLTFAGILFEIFRTIPLVNDMTDSGVANIHYLDIISLVNCLITLLVLVLQTSFVVDVSCRYLSDEDQWMQHPGRDAVTFLLVSNVSQWLLKSFQLIHFNKLQSDKISIAHTVYGDLPWIMMTLFLVPFCTLYYLYASARFGHVWYDTYRKHSITQTAGLREPRPVYNITVASTPDVRYPGARHRAPRYDADSGDRNLVDVVTPISDV